MLLAINWSEVGLQVGQLILSLSILVILHEFGHFLPAKWFKCRVEKFYLFFDPWFSLFKKKIGDTVYGIGWLPLGGYVKIAGMVDESMDKEQMKQPPQPWEFRSKPAWQRLIIMVGGVTVNILLAFFIYAMILYTWGETQLPMKNMKDGIAVNDSIAYKLGLKDGDKILAVNHKPVTYFSDLNVQLLLGQNNITLERDGKEQTLTIPVNLIEKIVEKGRRAPLVTVRMPGVVGALPDTSPAKAAGLMVKDQIVGVNDEETKYYDQVRTAFHSHKGDTVRIRIKRDNRDTVLQAKVSPEGTVGFYFYPFSNDELSRLGIYQYEQKDYGFFASFPAGVRKAGEKLSSYVQQFKMLLNPKTGAYKGLSGFRGMASIFPNDGWDWEAFWNITAFFSIALAFMNLLPIPALDGGHVLFTLIEMITGRRPSDKFLEYAQIVGMVLLLGLMLFANGNDWFGWGRGK